MMKAKSIASDSTFEEFVQNPEQEVRRTRSKPIYQAPQKKPVKAWNMFGMFSCCAGDPSANLSQHNRKKANEMEDSTARAVSHYRIINSNSFLDPQKDGQSMSISKLLKDRKFYISQTAYPREDLFLLGSALEKIICKFELIRVQSSATVSQARSQSVGLKRTNTNGGKLATTLQKVLKVEPVADHIAELISGMIIIDGMCGKGSNAVEFAKHCASLIAIESDSNLIKEAKNNAKTHDVEEKIDFVQANFLRMRKLKADVVFLAPTELPLQLNEQFSVFKHLKQDLEKVIEHALEFAANICIRLPCYTNPEEIGVLFSRIYTNNPIFESNRKFSLKIKQFEVDGVPDCIVVYFGAFNQIKENDIKEFLCDFASKSNDPAAKTEYPQPLIDALVRTMGVQFLVAAILNFQHEATNGETNTVLIKYLFDRAISVESIWFRLRAELKQNFDLLGIFESTGCFTDRAPLYAAIVARESSPKLRGSHRSQISLPSEEGGRTDRSSYKKKSNRMLLHLPIKDLTQSTTSDLALSSYSMRSAAMIDCESSPRSRRNASYEETDLASMIMRHNRTRSTGILGLIREEANSPASDSRHESFQIQKIKRNETNKTSTMRF